MSLASALNTAIARTSMYPIGGQYAVAVWRDDIRAWDVSQYDYHAARSAHRASRIIIALMALGYDRASAEIAAYARPYGSWYDAVRDEWRAAQFADSNS